MEQRNKELNTLETRLSTIQLIVVALCLIFGFFSIWLGENIFAYEVEKTKTVEEPYEYVIDEIWDYTCYTTTYGSCYHESGCGYLHSSSIKTNVADAKNNNYRACSRCDPPTDIPVIITETRYRTVTKTEIETKEPSLLIWIIGTCAIIFVYNASTKDLKKRINELSLHR